MTASSSCGRRSVLLRISSLRGFQVREAVLGRGDSGSLVADIVLPAAREVARMERVRSDFAQILQIQIRAGETDLGREGLLRRGGGEIASVGREIQGRVAGLCHRMRNQLSQINITHLFLFKGVL